MRMIDTSNTMFPWYIPIFARIFSLFFGVLADKVFVDHAATDVASLLGSDQTSLWPLLAPFTRWDAVYYLNIAKYGYTSESQYAFFPLFPYCIRFIAHTLHHVNKGVFMTSLLDDDDINYYVIAGLIVSNVSFVISSWLLWQIFSTSNGVMKRSIILLFSFNPASVFFSTVYTESFYSLFTFSNVLVLEKYNNIYVSLVIITLSAFVRSNGPFNGILLMLHILRGQHLHRVLTVRFMAGVTLLILFLYFLLLHTHNLGAVDICSNSAVTSSTCSSHHFAFDGKVFHTAYQLIQYKHWGIGLFSYYLVKNIPNFLLAAPMISICAYIIRCSYKKIESNGYLRQLLQDSHCFNVIYMTALVALIVAYAHVQIITRVICSSCPYLYYEIALLLTHHRELQVPLISYLVLFNIAGAVLHGNNYPWT